MGKSVHRWEVVNPSDVRLRIFTPFCFGSEAYTNNWGLFGKENYLTTNAIDLKIERVLTGFLIG
jgi:hypothetical protein